MAFYKFILQVYGILALNDFKILSSWFSKTYHVKNKKIFLLNCRRKYVVPGFLDFKVNIQLAKKQSKTKLTKLISGFKHQLLNLAIQDVCQEEKIIHQQFKKAKKKAENSSSRKTVSRFLSYESQRNEKQFEKKKQQQRKKIQKVLVKNETNFKEKFRAFFEKRFEWIVNLSNAELPEDVLSVLSLGSKFCVPFYQRDKENLLLNTFANIEAKIKYKNENIARKIRHLVGSIMFRFSKRYRFNLDDKLSFDQKEFFKSLYDQMIVAKKFFQKNKNLIVLNADKSNKTVIMEKADYKEKMLDLLSDTSIYKKIGRCLTYSMQNKCNSIVKNWLSKNFISKNTAKNLSISNAVPCKIYGLVKTHKEGMPLRPIVSSISSPFYNLSKFFGNILKKVVGKTENSVKNSFQFVEFLKTQTVPENFVLASLDLVSMYTNIPIKLALEVISEKWEKIAPHTSLPKDEFIYGIKSCLESTIFQFEDNFYKQINGLAMGGPVSAAIANLVLEYMEEKILSALPFRLLFYKRFVDDVIICCHKDDLERIFQFFNSFNENFIFTLECEKNGSISFLDVLITRKSGRFFTSWYQKPIFSGRYLNFWSVQPLHQKINVIQNLATRVCVLTHPIFRKNSIERAKKVLRQNCYPESLVNSIFAKVIHFSYNGFPPKKVWEKTEVVVCPYMSSVSEKLAGALNPYGLTVVSSNSSNLSEFKTPLKAKTPKEKVSNVVYQIPCKDCQGVYIGQSSQYVHKRMDGHKFAQEKTALKQHIKEKTHSFDFQNVRILKREKSEQVRLGLEGLCILKEKNAVNSRTEFMHYDDYFLNPGCV